MALVLEMTGEGCSWRRANWHCVIPPYNPEVFSSTPSPCWLIIHGDEKTIEIHLRHMGEEDWQARKGTRRIRHL